MTKNSPKVLKNTPRPNTRREGYKTIKHFEPCQNNTRIHTDLQAEIPLINANIDNKEVMGTRKIPTPLQRRVLVNVPRSYGSGLPLQSFFGKKSPNLDPNPAQNLRQKYYNPIRKIKSSSSSSLEENMEKFNNKVKLKSKSVTDSNRKTTAARENRLPRKGNGSLKSSTDPALIEQQHNNIQSLKQEILENKRALERGLSNQSVFVTEPRVQKLKDEISQSKNKGSLQKKILITELKSEIAEYKRFSTFEVYNIHTSTNANQDENDAKSNNGSLRRASFDEEKSQGKNTRNNVNLDVNSLLVVKQNIPGNNENLSENLLQTTKRTSVHGNNSTSGSTDRQSVRRGTKDVNAIHDLCGSERATFDEGIYSSRKNTKNNLDNLLHIGSSIDHGLLSPTRTSYRDNDSTDQKSVKGGSEDIKSTHGRDSTRKVSLLEGISTRNDIDSLLGFRQNRGQEILQNEGELESTKRISLRTSLPDNDSADRKNGRKGSEDVKSTHSRHSSRKVLLVEAISTRNDVESLLGVGQSGWQDIPQSESGLESTRRISPRTSLHDNDSANRKSLRRGSEDVKSTHSRDSSRRVSLVKGINNRNDEENLLGVGQNQEKDIPKNKNEWESTKGTPLRTSLYDNDNTNRKSFRRGSEDVKSTHTLDSLRRVSLVEEISTRNDVDIPQDSLSNVRQNRRQDISHTETELESTKRTSLKTSFHDNYSADRDSLRRYSENVKSTRSPRRSRRVSLDEGASNRNDVSNDEDSLLSVGQNVVPIIEDVLRSPQRTSFSDNDYTDRKSVRRDSRNMNSTRSLDHGHGGLRRVSPDEGKVTKKNILDSMREDKELSEISRDAARHLCFWRNSYGMV